MTSVIVSEWLISSNTIPVLVCDWSIPSHVLSILVCDWSISRLVILLLVHAIYHVYEVFLHSLYNQI